MKFKFKIWNRIEKGEKKNYIEYYESSVLFLF